MELEWKFGPNGGNDYVADTNFGVFRVTKLEESHVVCTLDGNSLDGRTETITESILDGMKRCEAKAQRLASSCL